MRSRAILACTALAVSVTASGTAAAFAGDNGGFKTGQRSMLSAVAAGVEITPLLTVGDVLPSGYRYEAVPDGISVRTRGQGLSPEARLDRRPPVARQRLIAAGAGNDGRHASRHVD